MSPTRGERRGHDGAMTSPLLIIWHSRTGTAEALALAAADGAASALAELCDDDASMGIRLRRAADVEPDEVLDAGGYLFCCPENLASMSGEMKEFVDRCYYPALDRIAGRPWGLIVAAGTDGTGVVRQFQRVAAGWRLRSVAEPLVVLTGADTPETIAAPKSVPTDRLEAAAELGATIAGGLALGLY